jgi:hypothetical protein
LSSEESDPLAETELTHDPEGVDEDTTDLSTAGALASPPAQPTPSPSEPSDRPTVPSPSGASAGSAPPGTPPASPRAGSESASTRRLADNTPVASPSTRSGSNAQPPAEDLTGHRLLDRYLIGNKLGAGGFGAVYEATDELKRQGGEEAQIAIKVLDRQKLGDRLDVLVQEVSRSHQVSHPNILRVYDIHVDSSFAFITMECLYGQDLKHGIARAKGEAENEKSLLPLSEVDHIAQTVCSALDYCHDQGLVHADIKPENIFLCDDGTVKILDLGISQVIGKQGQIRGYSAHYGSPQQIQGDPADPTDDLFSLGCVLFECLTGDRPFDDGSGRRVSSPTHKPQVSQLPRRYRKAVAQALEFDRDSREDSASDLWHRVSPAIRRRNAAVAFLAVAAATALIASNVMGRSTGEENIAVSESDQLAAENLYLEALNAGTRDAGAARLALVGALEANPYHEQAARALADQLRQVHFTDAARYSMVWSDFGAGLEAAPKSEPLKDLAIELTDSFLEIDASSLPRSAVLTRFRAPLCVLSNGDYRGDELDQMRVDLSIHC